jgi:intraflagellar transport protein 140
MPELDARVGLVAVQLGLTDDAARLFSSCERWDLVEQLHEASGGWQEALQAATKRDRLVPRVSKSAGLAQLRQPSLQLPLQAFPA